MRRPGDDKAISMYGRSRARYRECTEDDHRLHKIRLVLARGSLVSYGVIDFSLYLLIFHLCRRLIGVTIQYDGTAIGFEQTVLVLF